MPKAQQVLVELVNVGMLLPLGEIELTAVVSGDVAGIGEARPGLGLGKISELREKLNAALGNQRTEFLVMIGEEQERAGCCEFLALKQHRSPGREQEQGGDCFEAARSRHAMKAVSASGIGKLIVILDVIHKLRRSHPPRRSAATLRLPLITLPLEQIAMFDRG